MTQGRTLILTVSGAAAAAVLVALGTTSRLDVPPPLWLVVLFTVVFCVTGVLALARRPDNRVGWLLYAAGLAFAATGMPLSTNGVVFTVGLTLNTVVFAVIVHLVLAYPAGTLDPRERRLTQIGYVLALAGPTLPLFWTPDPSECDCGDNVLFVHDSPLAYGLFLHTVQLLAAVLLVAVVVQLVRRWRRATPAYRRAVRSVYAAGGLAITLLGLSLALQAVWDDGSAALVFGSVAAAGLMPVIVLAGLLGPRRARALVGRVVAELGPAPAPGHLRDVLREALHDPALEVGYWLPDLPGYVDIDGRAFDPAEADAATFVDGEEGRIGVIAHDSALLEEGTVLEGVVSAVRLVLENERLHADLRAKLAEIQQQQRFTDLIVDNAPALFAVIDGDGRVRGGVNDPLLRLFGLAHHEEIADRFFWDVFCVPEEAQATQARLAQVAAGSEVGPQEARLPLPGGEVRVVEWRDSILTDEQGQLKWIVRAGLDVTGRKRQADELSASRARIVQAADDARRKLERNLHDGAQQRLVSLSITLRLAEGKLEGQQDEARAALRAASEELGHALSELRELARGIHPAILSDRGLGPALHALADRATLPVTVVDELEDRLPDAVEAAAYFVVSESLANVAKHAGAETATVHVSRRNGYALVAVVDDGVGGADPRGSGLRGLLDRVEALDGRLGVESPPAGGTRVWAEIPC